MARQGELKKILKPFLNERHDLLFQRRRVFITPIRHIMRGCVLNGSMNPDAIYLHWFVMPPAEGDPIGVTGWGKELREPQFVWRLSKPGDKESMIETIRDIALPKVEHIDDFESYLALLTDPSMREPNMEKSIATARAALGDFQGAREALREPIEMLSEQISRYEPHVERVRAMKDRDRAWWWSSYESFSERVARMRRFCDLAQNDPRGLLTHLHEIEKRTVELRRLEKHWQPTPFPCEIKGST